MSDGTAGEGAVDLDAAPPVVGRQRFRWLRIGALAALFLGLWVLGKTTGWVDDLDPEQVRGWVADAGPLGIVIYVAIFSVGELLHVPGMVFVAAGILAYGKLAGYPIALAASVISVTVSFVVVRTVGGKPLAEVRRPFLRRILSRLDERPIRTVVILRSFLFLAPVLNYALAMTNVKLRDYVIGSILGLALPVLAMTFAFDWLLSNLDWLFT